MSAKSLVAVLALALVAGCAQIPKQAFNRDAAGHVRTVAIAHIDEPERYEAVMLGHPGASFGLIGGLVAAADMYAKSSRLTDTIDPAQTRLRQRFVDKLAAALAKAGYDVQPVVIPIGTPDGDVVAAARSKSASDAVLAINVIGRYMAAGATSDYFPQLLVKAKAFDAKSGATLYEDTFTYGFTLPRTQTVHFASDAGYRFKDIDVLLADPAKTREGLVSGIDGIVAQIAADLRRP
jgi:hypothetical protein